MEHDGNEHGLTELEDMRLNRLLRSTGSLFSPASSPSPPSDGGGGTHAHGADINRKGIETHSGGESRDHNRKGGKPVPSMPWDVTFDSEATVGSQCPVEGGGGDSDTLPFGLTDGVSRRLFGGSPEGERGKFRASSSSFASEHVKRVAAGRECSPAVVSLGRRLGLEQEDDLEDISDGGFHTGCWRRKYIRGEMR